MKSPKTFAFFAALLLHLFSAQIAVSQVISDQASLFADKEITRITDALQRLASTNGIEMAIHTVTSTRSADQFRAPSYLARDIVQDRSSSGGQNLRHVVLVVEAKYRDAAIAMGQGFTIKERAALNRIKRKSIMPHVLNRQWEPAVMAGVNEIAASIGSVERQGNDGNLVETIPVVVRILIFAAIGITLAMAALFMGKLSDKFSDARNMPKTTHATCPDCGSSLRGDASGVAVETCPVCAPG